MFLKCLLLLLAASFLSAGLVPSPKNRIVGGWDIRIEEAPWQVFIKAEKKPHCGGSILSKNIIITAAHCLCRKGTKTLLQAKDFQVLVGSEFWDSRNTLVQVAAIKANEKFIKLKLNRPGQAHDIGIMKLSKPLEWSRKVQPIPLATKEPAIGSLASTTGWGLSYRDNPHYLSHPRILQGVTIPIKGYELCKLTLPWLPKNIICAGVAGRSPCHGDSGGPLVVNRQLVGVVSSGDFECFNTGIYASVVYSRKWILDTIDALQRSKNI